MAFCIVHIFTACTNNSKPIVLLPAPTKNGVDKVPPSVPTNGTLSKVTSLSDSGYLRKLSLHIRGVPPSIFEYQALEEAQKNNDTALFFKNTSQEYLKSSYHVEKMNNRLNEYFRLRTDSYYNTTDWPVLKEELEKDEIGEFPYITYVQSHLHKSSLNHLFRTIIRENESWDQLLLKKDYRIFVSQNSSNFNFGALEGKDFYYSIAKSQFPPNANGFVNLQFDANDARIAGVLTTPRFFARYPNTSVNKNRKRAAALFRMFLCDSMDTVALDASQNEEQILKKIFPERSSGNLVVSKDRHGHDAACLKCHYKLDPVGMTFAGSSLSLSPTASRGSLVFKRLDSQKVELPVEGLGALAHKITQQPEYTQCQTQLLWNWFIGSDSPLSQKDSLDLQSQFEKDKRRVNDFITYIVNTPQFTSRSPLVSENELERKVKTIFKRCDSCHKEEKNIPTFVDWPIGGSETLMKSYIKKITKVLDLKGNGNAATMPPPQSSWRLSKQEREALQLWVEKQTDSVVMHAFKSVQLRYLGGPDLILTLANKFSFWKSKNNEGLEKADVPSYCRFAANETSSKLGVSSPKTGRPIHENPSPSMARWLLDCGRAYIEADFKNSLLTEQLSHYFAPHFQKQFQLNQKEKLNAFLNQRWNVLTPDIQKQMVSYWTEYLLGPEELLSDVTQGQFINMSEFSDALIRKIPHSMTQLNLKELIPQILLTLIMQDAFLQY